MKKNISTLAALLASVMITHAQNANQNLSNLVAPVAINKDLLPASNGAYNLGEPPKAWKNLSLTGIIYLKNEPFLKTVNTGSLFLGTNAGNSTTSSFNTGFGYYALYKNQSGINNTATGYQALYNNLTGSSNTATGHQALFSNTANGITAFGYKTLYANTSGSENTGVGYQALLSNITGSSNTSVGWNSLNNNTGGSYNTAIGVVALEKNSTGSFNTALGFDVLTKNTTGSGNTASGTAALRENVTGENNVAFGNEALLFSTSASNNTAIGAKTLSNNTSGENNTAIGYQALNANTASGNTAIGFQSLMQNSVGYNNTATGYQALSSTSIGNNNTANGASALAVNTTGYFGVAMGAGALSANTTGGANTAVGHNALTFNTEGTNNTALGEGAMLFNVSGTNNTALGNVAFGYNTKGSNNTSIGNYSMVFNKDGLYNTSLGFRSGNVFYEEGDNAKDANTSACTFLGATANVVSTTQYNTTVIGYNARAASDNQVVIGNANINSIGGYANWTNFSDGRYKKNVKEDVPGLTFIKELRPVTYTLDIAGVNKTNSPVIKAQAYKKEKLLGPLVGEDDATSKENELAKKAEDEKSKIVYTGFVAQEVESAAKKLNYDFSGVKKPANDKDYYGLRYAEFVVPLVKAVQELSAENEELKARLAAIEQLLGKTGNAGTFSLCQNTLGQNVPNPANGRMTIPFNLSQKSQHASIVITEVASGKVLKTIPVTSSQKSVIVELANVASGTYSYSLVVNNKMVDSKKMVVTR